MNVLVTGAAGFIGFHLCRRLIQEGYDVVGVDNFNSYYSVELKRRRAAELRLTAESYNSDFELIECAIEDEGYISNVFHRVKPTHVVNLAAQAGVRHSIEHPNDYISSNLCGFGVILEQCRRHGIRHLLYASSSSVYGGCTPPFSEKARVDTPVSLYAATKKANELMAHSYSHLYRLPCTGLRFFTVYGPWGRPDMALFLFTEAIASDKPIRLFNSGNMVRDFTYIDDVVESVFRLLGKIPTIEEGLEDRDAFGGLAPCRVLNVGNSKPRALLEYVEAIERHIGKKSIRENLPMQAGDVKVTAADTKLLEDLIEYKPATDIEEGIKEFVKWYREYSQMALV